MTTELIERKASLAWVPPEHLSYETWAELGARIGREAQRFQWLLGDWHNYGEARWDNYAEAMEATGFAYQTLANYAWVAKAVDVSRRRESLSFTHHAEVAGLDPEAQETMLAEAEIRGLSAAQLRAAVRGLRSGEPTEKGLSAWATISLRVPRELEPTWDAARDAVIQREGIELHEDAAIARGQVLEVLLASYLASA